MVMPEQIPISRVIDTDFGMAWIARQSIDKRGVFVPLAYIDINDGKHNDAMLFSQLLYWYTPDAQGYSKLRIFEEGRFWLGKTHGSWWRETRLKENTIPKILSRLQARKLIYYKSCSDNHNCPLIAVNWHEFERQMSIWMNANGASADEETYKVLHDLLTAADTEQSDIKMIPPTQQRLENDTEADGTSVYMIENQRHIPLGEDWLFYKQGGQLTAEGGSANSGGGGQLTDDPYKTTIQESLREKEKTCVSDSSDTQVSPLGEKPQKEPKPKDPMYDAIAAVFNAHAYLNGYIRILLTGETADAKNHKSEWYKCHLEQAATAEEITQFGEWYKKKCKDVSLPRKPEKIQSWFMQFRAEGTPQSKPSTYAEWKAQQPKNQPGYYQTGTIADYVRRKEGQRQS